MDFKVDGAMEHWKVLSITMVGWQEKFLNSSSSRLAKTVAFWPWRHNFNSFCFETFFFSFDSLFTFCYAKKWGSYTPRSAPLSMSPALKRTSDIHVTDIIVFHIQGYSIYTISIYADTEYWSNLPYFIISFFYLPY